MQHAVQRARVVGRDGDGGDAGDRQPCHEDTERLRGARGQRVVPRDAVQLPVGLGDAAHTVVPRAVGDELGRGARASRRARRSAARGRRPGGCRRHASVAPRGRGRGGPARAARRAAPRPAAGTNAALAPTATAPASTATSGGRIPRR